MYISGEPLTLLPTLVTLTGDKGVKNVKSRLRVSKVKKSVPKGPFQNPKKIEALTKISAFYKAYEAMSPADKIALKAQYVRQFHSQPFFTGDLDGDMDGDYYSDPEYMGFFMFIIPILTFLVKHAIPIIKQILKIAKKTGQVVSEISDHLLAKEKALPPPPPKKGLAAIPPIALIGGGALVLILLIKK